MSQTVLKKSITYIEAVALVIGVIIGSGIFLKPGKVFAAAGSPLMGLAAWVIGGIITLASALTIAEIAAAIPKTGGLYTYLEELYGEVWGFLLGWVQTVITYPAAGAALAIAFTTYSTFFIPMNDLQQKALAVLVIVFVITMNVLATRFGGIIQTVSTIGKLIPIVVIIAFGLIDGQTHDFSNMPVLTQGAGMGAAILGTLWAYDGWIGVTNIAGELKNPAKEMPRAIVLGVLVCIAVYVLINVALLNVSSVETLIASKTPASDVAIVLFGTGGAAFITGGIMVSVFGAMNGYLLTGARVPLAMADRNQLPFSSTLGAIHKNFQTPSNALIFEGVLAIAYVFSGTFNTLTDLLVFVLWIFFTLGVVGIFILRKRVSADQRPYKVPFYPLTPLIGIIGGLFILYSTVIDQPQNSLYGILITLIGLPVFYFMKVSKTKKV